MWEEGKDRNFNKQKLDDSLAEKQLFTFLGYFTKFVTTLCPPPVPQYRRSRAEIWLFMP